MSWSRCDSRRSRSIFWTTRRSRVVSGFWNSSASRSRFKRHGRQRVADLVGEAAGELGDLGVLFAEAMVLGHATRRGGPVIDGVGLGLRGRAVAGDEVGHGKVRRFGQESGQSCLAFVSKLRP